MVGIFSVSARMFLITDAVYSVSSQFGRHAGHITGVVRSSVHMKKKLLIFLSFYKYSRRDIKIIAY